MQALRDHLSSIQSLRSQLGWSPGRYELQSTLSSEELAEAETQYGVPFPEEYRRFLLEIGRGGGLGPNYGVFPLVTTEGRWHWEGDGGELTTRLDVDWPHSAAWNLNGHEIWGQKPDDDDDALEAWYERFWSLSWNETVTHGGICISHRGCALRQWLVVSGPQRGNIWSDDRADRNGLSPDNQTFAEWYQQWVTEALEDATQRVTRLESG